MGILQFVNPGRITGSNSEEVGDNIPSFINPKVSSMFEKGLSKDSTPSSLSDIWALIENASLKGIIQ